MVTSPKNTFDRFDAIAEKDLDLMLLEEFCSSAHWCRWFYERIRASKPDLPDLTHLEADAARSVSGMGRDGRAGETDIMVVLTGVAAIAQQKVAVLIEDKISAAFTPDQGRRYADRAIVERDENKCDHCVTVLISPTKYQAGPEKSFFDVTLTLEEIGEYFEKRCEQLNGELSRRMRHRSLLIQRACGINHRYTSTGVIPHERNTVTIQSIESYVQSNFGQLLVKPRIVRGRASYGPGFDLPSKAAVRAAAKLAGLGVKGGQPELNFNWFLAEGKIRIRFHWWPVIAPLIRDWFCARLAPDVSCELSKNGKSVDLSIEHLPRIDGAKDESIDSDGLERWCVEAIRLQDWFESLASEFATWLGDDHRAS